MRTLTYIVHVYLRQVNSKYHIRSIGVVINSAVNKTTVNDQVVLAGALH